MHKSFINKAARFDIAFDDVWIMFVNFNDTKGQATPTTATYFAFGDESRISRWS